MNPNNQNCDDFEPMVSAMIDGELSLDEQGLLSSHLDDCVACRRLLTDFEAVDIAVETLAPASSLATLEKRTETFVLTRQKPSLKSWLSVWRLVPLAAVAALMVGMFLVTTNQTAPVATAEQLTAEQFVKPMTDLNRINHQQQRDQDLMLRTLGMDLRSLKLELKQLENAAPEERLRLEKQIEKMLHRVEEFETN